MDALPPLSTGVFVAEAPCGGVAYDALDGQLHLVNPAGWLVLDACRASTSPARLTAQIAGGAGCDETTAARSADRVLATFTSLGVIGREAGPLPGMWAVSPPSELDDGEHVSMQVAGPHRIRFRSTDADLITAVAERLGMAQSTGEGPGGSVDAEEGARAGSEDHEVTDDFRLVPTALGGVTLLNDTVWEFPSAEALLDQLVFVVTDYVARSTLVTTLHAGAARSPAGATVVFPAPAGSGKSTLVAALVRRGWGYLSDESAGIDPVCHQVLPFVKPLRLSAASCAALGVAPRVGFGDDLHLGQVAPGAKPVWAGQPVRLVVSPRYRLGGEPCVEGPLEFTDALRLLLESTTNLRPMAHEGIEVLCALAASVPVFQITYGSTAEAFALLGGLLE